METRTKILYGALIISILLNVFLAYQLYRDNIDYKKKLNVTSIEEIKIKRKRTNRVDALNYLRNKKNIKKGDDPYKKLGIKVGKIKLSRELEKEGVYLSPEYIPDKYAKPEVIEETLKEIKKLSKKIK